MVVPSEPLLCRGLKHPRLPLFKPAPAGFRALLCYPSPVAALRPMEPAKVGLNNGSRGFNPRRPSDGPRHAGLRRGVLAAVALLTLPLLTGCPAPNTGSGDGGGDGAPPPNVSQDRSGGAFETTDPWVLKATKPDVGRGNHGIFLGNGFLGATFGVTGGAGKDARAYIAGHYDQEETLAPISNWHEIGLPDPKPGEPYEQTLDMKRGVLTTKMGGVTVTAFVSAADPYLAGIRVEGAQPGKMGEVSAGAGKFAVDVWGGSTDAGATRLVRIRPEAVAQRVPNPPKPTFEEALAAHEAAWAKRWEGRDIVIEGDPVAQQLVHKAMFDLLQSTRPGGDDSVPPETLSGEFYKGHIFWDADIWIFPALLAQYPEMARNILDYRFRHLEAAKALAKAQGYKGADFPWESAATGKETAPGGFAQGRHVTAGVGWAHWQYWLATQDKKWLAERGWPVLSAVADFFASRVTKNAATGKYDLKDVTGPDEFKQGITNNTYTNAMARNCLIAATEAAKVLGRPADPKWAEVAKNIALPFDKEKGVYLVREGDDGKKGTKQADGELLLWPAELPMDEKTAAATFAFHADRPITNGPAMTDSIHALGWARLGKAKEAAENFEASYRPFVRGPFLLFSEKRSLDRCDFATGQGGLLQSVLYGFGGLDWDEFQEVERRPVALPEAWKRLTITGIQRGGKTYTLNVTPQGRTLTAE